MADGEAVAATRSPAEPHRALLVLARLLGRAAARNALAAQDVEGIATDGED